MPGSHGSGDKSYNSMPVKITPFNLSPMDYVKNKIEEAIRTGGYDNAASQPHTNHPGPMGAHGSNTPAYGEYWNYVSKQNELFSVSVSL